MKTLDLITNKEAAELLGLASSTIRAWSATARHGFPAPYRFGARVLFSRSELIRWAESRRKRTT